MTQQHHKFDKAIRNAYLGRHRSVIEATGHLQCEASELAELLLKKKWYGKDYSNEDVLSEAGDILNFLTFILQEHNLTIEQAMENNIQKLLNRGWVTNENS